MSDTTQQQSEYWKSLGEREGDPQLLEQLRNEFPADYDQPSTAASGMTRRTFVGLLAASAAFAATGCRRPEQEIVPYVNKPEYLVPGVANHFATSFAHEQFAAGLLVRSREGRPVKIEGNDRDPVSGGKSTHLAQASLLALYDPDRMLRPTVNNSDSTPQNAIIRMAEGLRAAATGGKQVRIVTGSHASPSLAALYAEMEAVLPNCSVVRMPAIASDATAEASRRLLGVDGVIVPDLSRAQVILGVDADFLGTDPEALYHIRNFASRRTPEQGDAVMSRYYAVEAGMTVSGLSADHRVRIHPSEFDEFLLALLHEVIVVRGRGPQELSGLLSGAGNSRFELMRTIADDLLSGSGVVMTGRHLPWHTQALGLLANQAIGAVGTGKPVDPARVLPFSASQKRAIESLKAELKSGKVGAVIFADANAAYAMGDARFRDLMSKVPYRFSLSQYADETSKYCSIYIPVNHYLEAWGDTASFLGTQSVVQPLIAPLNDAQLSLGDALLGLTREFAPETVTAENFYTYVQERWKADLLTGGDFRSEWTKVLKDGTFETPSRPQQSTPEQGAAAAAVRSASKSRSKGLTVGVLPSHALYDGRYANLGWLMELPDPVTKATWDNVAAMSKATASRLGVARDDVVALATDEGSITAPVFIQPGMADDVIITTTGFGRSEGGRVASGKGSNAFELFAATGYAPVDVQATGATHAVATTQDHHSLSGSELYDIDRSDIVKSGTLAAFLKDPSSLYDGDLPVYGAEKNTDRPISIMPEHSYDGPHRWGMTIDTSACVGCNACITSCDAENNIPMVGRDQVLRGREMHWIRIDLYYSGDEDNPDATLQPMLCQHCENAPCENVCPVAATTHSPEGLNEMTYNRCVGTRYCSNNCPYKVRRFNYLNNHRDLREPENMVFNPDVTVRMRGVMEKCTFCVQRINEAKHHAKNEGRDTLREGEVVSACQQACPADAIVFGNMNDPDSAVSRHMKSQRGYHVLRELNVVPSITYLAKIRNTNGGAA